MTIKEILDEYNQKKTIKGTAKSLGISDCVVRKTLITYRVIDSPRIQRIAELRAAGMPGNAIADILGVSRSCITSNSPYQRGTYLNPSQTPNAQRIRKCRGRRKKSAESD